MAFPRINTKATNITVTPQLEALLDQKLTPLGRLIDERDESWCEVELEKIAAQQSGRIFRAEINLSTGGKLFRTDATEEQIEKAIDEARDELKRELQRAHGKKQSLLKRGGQALKRMMLFGRSE